MGERPPDPLRLGVIPASLLFSSLGPGSNDSTRILCPACTINLCACGFAWRDERGARFGLTMVEIPSVLVLLSVRSISKTGSKWRKNGRETKEDGF